MTKKEKLELVRSELKELKVLSNKISLALKSQDAFLELKQTILKSKKTSLEPINKFCKKWSKTSLKSLICRYASLAIKYTDLISDFSELDKAVFAEAYINGTPLKAVAIQFFYSYEAITKRLRKIRCKLAERYVG